MGLLSGITGTLFGKKARPQESRSGLSQLIEIFPELKNVGQDIIRRGRDIANNDVAFTPSEIAKLSDLEQQGLMGLSRARPTFAPRFGFGQQAKDVFTDAQGLLNIGSNPITEAEIQSGIRSFLNPYQQDVIDPMVREVKRAGLGMLSDIASDATGAGAFGGDRQALLESRVPWLVAQQVGDISGKLLNQGFESAANRALSNLQFGRGLQLKAGTAMAGLGSNLFNARQGVQNIQSQQLLDEINRANAQISAGSLPRTIQQRELGREAAINRIPIQQLGLLQNVMSGFPASQYSIGKRAGTSGLLSSGGDKISGIRNISGAFL